MLRIAINIRMGGPTIGSEPGFSDTARAGMMQAPPENPEEYRRAGEDLWKVLWGHYQRIATARDAELLAKPPERHDRHREYQQALKRFDEYIVDQAGFWGWRMDMCSEVVRAKARWEATNPDLPARYGQQQTLKSKFFCGQKSAPIAQGMEEFADGAIVELQSLLRRQREEFTHRGPNPRCEKIAAWMKVEIEARPADHPLLHATLGQLIGYVQNLPRLNRKVATLLESGRLRPDSFFYQWFATAHAKSVKTVRNELSLRRRQALEPSSRK